MRVIAKSIALTAASLISLATFRESWTATSQYTSSATLLSLCHPTTDASAPSLLRSSSSSSSYSSIPSSLPATEENASQSQPQDEKDAYLLSCLRTVLTSNELPIGDRNEPRVANVVKAHLGDAKRWWNVGHRFNPVEALQPTSPVPPTESSPNAAVASGVEEEGGCSVWEVGAHTQGADSAQFLKQYPHCRYHAYEPVQAFADELRKNWESETRMSVHPYGFGAEAQEFSLPAAALQGESTYIADFDKSAAGADATDEASLMARIVTFETALEEAGGQYPTLMHLNCEGCEWEFLPQAHKAGFLQRVEVIQIGTRYYGDAGLGPRVWQLCEIRHLLSLTHDMEWGMGFAWERWVRRPSSVPATD